MSATLICLVVAITDGDTLKARCGAPGSFEQVTVRIAQIDAPERGQAFGQRSRQALADLCFQQTATLSRTSMDRYKRTVADVECGGTDAGQHMVKSGWACVYDKYVIDRGLYALQDAARGARVGIWAQEAVPPWEWRRQR